MERKYSLLGYFMLLLFPLVFLAFYKSYFEHFPQFADRIKYFDHIHASLAILWVLMLIVQPVLIVNRKYSLHRTIGRGSYLVFPLFFLSFLPREIILIQGDHPKDLFFPLADSLVLLTLYVLAVRNKKNIGNHMRYMISSALVLLGPTIGRIGPIWLGLSFQATQYIQYGITLAILLMLIIYDGRIQKSRPYLLAAGLFAVHALAFTVLYII